MMSIPDATYEHLHDAQLSRRPTGILRHGDVHEEDDAVEWWTHKKRVDKQKLPHAPNSL